MKTIIRLSERQFEKLEVQYGVRYNRPESRALMDCGYNCIETPFFIFIYAEEPERESPEYKHWRQAFEHLIVVDGKISFGKGGCYLSIKLRRKQ